MSIIFNLSCLICSRSISYHQKSVFSFSDSLNPFEFGYYFVINLIKLCCSFVGQKPFKCPRCPVTFSTKSNRERHLIRKHGVNMLDPMSRQTMDRPYKCHLCVFSSFSTQGKNDRCVNQLVLVDTNIKGT